MTPHELRKLHESIPVPVSYTHLSSVILVRREYCGPQVQKEVRFIMPKITGKYETVFIVDVNLGEENIAAMVEKFKTLIENNGTVTNVNEWGKRRLAYPINDMNEGYYVPVSYTHLDVYKRQVQWYFEYGEYLEA